MDANIKKLIRKLKGIGVVVLACVLLAAIQSVF